jgi:hypothetical protein
MRDSQSFQNNPSNPFCSTPAESSRSITRSIIADATATALIPSRGCLGVSAGTLNPHCCTASDCSRSRAGPRSRSRAARFRDDTTYDLAAPGSIGGSLARPSKGPPRCAIVRRERERERERTHRRSAADGIPPALRLALSKPLLRGGEGGRGRTRCRRTRLQRFDVACLPVEGGGRAKGRDAHPCEENIYTARCEGERDCISLSLSLSLSPRDGARFASLLATLSESARLMDNLALHEGRIAPRLSRPLSSPCVTLFVSRMVPFSHNARR